MYIARLGTQPQEHRGDPVEQSLVAGALKIERRRQQEARAAQHQSGAALRDGILHRRGGDADHELGARVDAGADQGAQRALAFVETKRGALARRAEHGQAVAAVGQRLAAVRRQPRQVDRSVLSERRSESDGKTEARTAKRH
jgi:hypothetical protein